MTLRHDPVGPQRSLQVRISQAEGRLAARRKHLGVAMAALSNDIRSSMVSPRALTAAVVFGVMVERSRTMLDWRLLTFMGTANAALGMLSRTSSGIRRFRAICSTREKQV